MAQAAIGDFVRLDDAGNRHGFSARINIERLVESRMLIQAASGFGKTSLLVELVEATHPHIQQIIVDPEGEFSVMRKDHDFVIASAHGGDALAHPRTAGLLATRLLEHKASAILDIYDVKPRERHEFVRNFIDSLMNAPKALWHPVLIILDEAHLFCPEKGFGESEAMDAVIDLAGRGRKRGFTLVAATQRIAKFNKNAAAELNNKFIGSASLDMDVKRAAFELGMTPKDALVALRKLKPGEFYAFGPALSATEPSLFLAHLPTTTLPKAGHRKLTAPPKPTDKIRALLPQLADIPKEVEHKAKTEAELRKELATTKNELEHLKRTTDVQVRSLSNLKAPPAKKPNYKEAHRIAKAYKDALGIMMRSLGGELQRDISKLVKDWEGKLFHQVNHDGENFLEKIREKIEEPEIQISGKPIEIQLVKRDVKPGPPLNYTIKEELVTDSLIEILGPQQRVLDAIAWMEKATGNPRVTQTAAAFLAGYTPGSSAFRNPRSALAAAGYLRYVDSDLELTAKGREQAAWLVETPTASKIQEKVLELLTGPPRNLLEVLLGHYPAGRTQEEHAVACGYTPGSSAYRNPRSKLSALGLLRYEDDSVYAAKWLFLE